ncbi:MAG TPA: energy transducer TonB, partial [Thermoanaerobaculia bacterium]|nr:energy transducer TonB [Thermoanaerobaculia bacterium]
RIMGGEFTMKTFAFLTVLLVACGPEPSFPVRPPAAPVWPPAARKLAALAGKKAIDCGTAVDRNSADRVYECAATALARRRPFYCRYSRPLPPIVDDTGHSFPGIDVSPARIGGVWAWATAFVGTSAGVVYAVNQSSFSLGPPLLIPGATPPPRRLGVGMTVPVPVSTATAVLPPRTAYVSGLVIVEAIIDADGSVSQTRVLKPLPEQVGAAAEALVRRTMFRPSRFFGVAVPVLYNVSVDVRDAKATVR